MELLTRIIDFLTEKAGYWPIAFLISAFLGICYYLGRLYYSRGEPEKEKPPKQPSIRKKPSY